MHPPWAHWGFFITRVIAGTLAPIALLANALNGSAAADWWVAIALIGVWLASRESTSMRRALPASR
jgi:hypothetical protein